MAVTRLGLYGASRKPYASFAGKTAYVPPASKPYVKTFTRLGQHGGARIPYGAFTGKTETVVIPTAQATGRGRRRRRYYSVEIDEQIFVFASVADVEAFLQQVREEAETAAETLVTSPEVPRLPRIRVKTASGKPTASKSLTKAVRATRKAVSKAYTAQAQRRGIDKEISELLLAKLEAARREEEDIIALLLVS